MEYTPGELNQCGVYRILNTRNGRTYIGCTGRTFAIRWQQHRYELNAGRHGNRGLLEDWRLYGPEAFSFEILEVCRKGTTKYWLNVREGHYLDQLTNTAECFHYSTMRPAWTQNWEHKKERDQQLKELLRSSETK